MIDEIYLLSLRLSGLRLSLSTSTCPERCADPGKGKGDKLQLNSKAKILLILALIAIVTFAHYSTEMAAHQYHLVYQGLFFIPIMLAGFWLGLSGALETSCLITLIYLPFTIIKWDGWSPGDLNSVLEMILYNAVAAVLGVLKDREMREQKRSREAESLAATGRAMSGLAHDIRTPLVAIGLVTSSVRQQLEGDHPGYKDLELVASEIRRLEEMLNDTLDFARPLSLNRRPESINRVVQESISIVEKANTAKAVRIETSLHDCDPEVSIDKVRLKQALINLLANAVQASPDGRDVMVCTHRSGHDTVVEIIDYGEKIDPALLARVFEPFFTTKAEGTGLGLPIARKIVEAHGGRLTVQNNPDQGVIFRMLLPSR